MVYEIILPSIPFIGGYLGTYALYKGNYIKKSMHVNIWNLIIGIAFFNMRWRWIFTSDLNGTGNYSPH
ncbi:MAG: hypothetical protein ACXVHU_06165 [Methanobacterium sp.]